MSRLIQKRNSYFTHSLFVIRPLKLRNFIESDFQKRENQESLVSFEPFSVHEYYSLD